MLYSHKCEPGKFSLFGFLFSTVCKICQGDCASGECILFFLALKTNLIVKQWDR